jgi:exosortase/archaeosortase family protein
MTESQQPPPESPKRDGRRARRRMIVFIVVFVLGTFGLLYGYGAAQHSYAMDRYLFSVAKHTSWSLRLIGHSASLESSGSWAGREGPMRAQLRAWETGSTPENTPAMRTAEPAATAWECWRYRALEQRKNRAVLQHALAIVTPPPHTQITSREQHVGFLDARIVELELAIPPKDTTGRELPGWQSSAATIDELRGSLEAARNAGDLSQLGDRIISTYDSIRQQLATRFESTDALYREMGPLVHFVYTPGVSTRIAELQRELKATRQDAELTDDLRSARLVALEAEIRPLHEQLRAAIEAGEDNSARGQSFAFRVVPDCGALPSMTIFLCAVFAFPTRGRNKFIGAALGLPLLYVVNVIRLSCLAIIGALTSGGEVFDFAHHYVWQGIFVIFVVAVWLLWVEFIVRIRAS